MGKTEQINVRLPVEWLNTLTAIAEEMTEETGEKFNIQDIIKLTLMDKFNLIPN